MAVIYFINEMKSSQRKPWVSLINTKCLKLCEISFSIAMFLFQNRQHTVACVATMTMTIIIITHQY